MLLPSYNGFASRACTKIASYAASMVAANGLFTRSVNNPDGNAEKLYCLHNGKREHYAGDFMAIIRIFSDVPISLMR